MSRVARACAATGVRETDEALRWIGRLFDTVPVPESPLPAAVRLTPDRQELWQSVQATLRPGSLADADVACLLAGFGVDYQRNVRRILRAYTLRGGFREDAADSRTPRGAREALARIPGHAARLYHRWRDQALLNWLLSRRTVSPHLLTVRNEALLSLWDDHWMEILRAAERAGADGLAEALAYARPLVPEPLVWAAYVRQLGLAADSGEAALRRTVLGILSRLHEGRDP